MVGGPFRWGGGHHGSQAMCGPLGRGRKRGNRLPCQAFSGHLAAFVGPSSRHHQQQRPMAFIPYVPYPEATGLLEELYQRYGGGDGAVDNVVRIHSLNPRSMRDHMDLYSHLMRGASPLSRVQREMIAVAVSAANDCFY
jgi:hypothetical protein